MLYDYLFYYFNTLQARELRRQNIENNPHYLKASPTVSKRKPETPAVEEVEKPSAVKEVPGIAKLELGVPLILGQYSIITLFYLFLSLSLSLSLLPLSPPPLSLSEAPSVRDALKSSKKGKKGKKRKGRQEEEELPASRPVVDTTAELPEVSYY